MAGAGPNGRSRYSLCEASQPRRQALLESGLSAKSAALAQPGPTTGFISPAAAFCRLAALLNPFAAGLKRRRAAINHFGDDR